MSQTRVSPSADEDCDFGLYRDEQGRLVYLDAAGDEHVGVAPVRAFPITGPQQWISICDSGGRELRSIKDLAELPPKLRQLVEEGLAEREFSPVLLRVKKVSRYLEPCQWDVDTDRGPTQFVLKSEDDVRRLGPHQAIIIDAHGIRYLVPDTRNLDATSRRIVERYL
jgi:hypothetical protein